MNFELSINTLLTLGFGAITLVLGAFLQRQTEKLKIAQAQLSERKYGVYHEIVSIFFDMLKDVKANKPIDVDVLTVRMLDLKKDLLIYGSDKILFKLSEWLSYTSNNSNDGKHIFVYLDMLILIRKDMGNRKTKINRKSIMMLIMQEEKEYDEFIKIL